MRSRIHTMSLVLSLVAGCRDSGSRDQTTVLPGRLNPEQQPRIVQATANAQAVSTTKATHTTNTPGSSEQQNRHPSTGSVRAMSISLFPSDDRQLQSALSIGSPVPRLEDLQLVSGPPLTEFSPGRTRIVHFWAPWNLLSRHSVPALSALQRELGEQTVVIHVTREDSESIAAFLRTSDPATGRQLQELTAGTIAVDEEGTLMRVWQQASGARGLPTAFLISSDGTLQWFGPALSVERPLRKLLSGSWNPELATVLVGMRNELETGIGRNGPRDLVARARTLAEAAPDDPEAVLILLDQLVAARQYDEVALVAERALRLCGDDADALAGLGWLLVLASEDSRMPQETALRAAERAVELSGRQPAALELLARVYFRSGRISDALAVQRDAATAAAPSHRPLAEAILREYERAGR